MSTSSAAAVPAHVPPELVLDYPLYLGATSYENPFDKIIPAIHEGPAAFYSLNAYPGHTPAWVFRRAEDLQAIYDDIESFSNKDFAPFAKLVGESWSTLPAET